MKGSCYYKQPVGWYCSRVHGHDGPCACREYAWHRAWMWLGYAWHRLTGCGPFIPIAHRNEFVWMCKRCGRVNRRKVVTPRHA